MSPKAGSPIRQRDIRRRPLFALLPFFAAGIWLGTEFEPDACALSLCAAFYLALCLVRPTGNAAFCALWIIFGAWRAAWFEQSICDAFPPGENLFRIRALVVEAPFPGHWLPRAFTSNSFVVRLESVEQPGGWSPASGHLSILCDRAQGDLARGDRLEIFGMLEGIPAPSNPGESDRRKHWRTRGVAHRMEAHPPANVVLLARNRGCPVLNGFSRLRTRYVGILRDALGERAGGFLAVLVLGARPLLPPEDRDRFSASGLFHLLAISGFHISIAAALIWCILGRVNLPMPFRAFLLLSLLLAYGALTGMQAPVVRTLVMAALCLIAPLIGREADPLNCLAGAALLILCCNPQELGMPGFQLSFAACLAILLWRREGPEPDPESAKAKGASRLRAASSTLLRYLLDSLWISLAASLGTAPLVAWHFSCVTPLAPLFTVAVVPAVVALHAGSLLFLFSPLGLGWVGEFLAALLGLAFSIFDTAMEAIGSCPASFPVLPPLSAMVAAFYLALWIWHYLPSKWRFAGIVVLASITVLFSGRLRALGGYESGFTVLDVRHGCSIYIRLPGPRHVLYDCGSMSPEIGRRVILPFLRSRGILRLDAIILSHYDQDHYGALREILPAMPVRKLLANRSFLERGEEIARMARLWGVEVVEAGDGIVPGFEEIELFSPGEKSSRRADSDNEHSMLALLTLGGRRALFTADAGPSCLDAAMKRDLGAIDLLQVPHHGGFVANTEAFLDAWNPKCAFLNARKGFADPQTLSAYRRKNVRVLSAAESGALEFAFEEMQR